MESMNMFTYITSQAHNLLISRLITSRRTYEEVNEIIPSNASAIYKNYLFTSESNLKKYISKHPEPKIEELIKYLKINNLSKVYNLLFPKLDEIFVQFRDWKNCVEFGAAVVGQFDVDAFFDYVLEIDYEKLNVLSLPHPTPKRNQDNKNIFKPYEQKDKFIVKIDYLEKYVKNCLEYVKVDGVVGPLFTIDGNMIINSEVKDMFEKLMNEKPKVEEEQITKSYIRQTSKNTYKLVIKGISKDKIEKMLESKNIEYKGQNHGYIIKDLNKVIEIVESEETKKPKVSKSTVLTIKTLYSYLVESKGYNKTRKELKAELINKGIITESNGHILILNKKALENMMK